MMSTVTVFPLTETVRVWGSVAGSTISVAIKKALFMQLKLVAVELVSSQTVPSS